MNQSNQNPKDNQQFSANQAPRPNGMPPRQGAQTPHQGGQNPRPSGQAPRQGQPLRQPMGQAPRQGGQNPRPNGMPPRQGAQTPQHPMGQTPHQGGQNPRPSGQAPRQGQPLRQPMGQAPRQSGHVLHQNEQAQQSTNNNHASQPAHQSTNTQQANANGIPPFLTTMKGIAIALGGAVMLGLLLGLLMGGGSSSQPKTQCSGFEKLVIRNKDITNRMPLCGRTDRGQACLLYIMNTSRYDETAEKFFKKAAELTGMQNYSIQMVNPQYAKQRIPAGYFVEIKIPAMK